MNETEPKLKTPKWLKHLQENSWEAEIIISGGAIFSLFQLVEYVVQLREYFLEIAPFDGLNEVLVLLVLVLRGISVGFIIHLLLRGFWIGLVCLRSVYPGGINFEKLHLSGSYLRNVKAINLTKQIVFLDHCSGLVFLGSFLFAIVFVGVIILLFSIAKVSELGVPSEILLLLLLPYLLDLFTGLLRRNEKVGKFYLPIYWLINIISLGFIYRPYLQILSTNTKRFGILLFFIILFSISLAFTLNSVKGSLHISDIFDKRKYEPVFYDDAFSSHFITEQMYLDKLPENLRVSWAAIQSDIIKDDILKVFIPYRAGYDSSISKEKIKALTEVVTISLNDSIITKPRWFIYQRKPSDQLGIISYLTIDRLPKGENKVEIKIKGYRFYANTQEKLIIPFWR